MTDTEIIAAIGKHNLTIMVRPDRITASWVICYNQVREHHNYGLNRGCDDSDTIRSVIQYAVNAIKSYKIPDQ
jgi:hypothetical protein